MTHFIGAVLVPSTVEQITNTYPTKYPDLYGKGAREWVPGTYLNEFLNEALERFNEQRDVNIWQPKAALIEKARKQIEDYRDGTYARYLKDPEEYRLNCLDNRQHFEYVSTEFPLKLQWTDEEIYQNEVLKWEQPEDIRESDGAVHTTYNPDSKWDWWTIGGRWEKSYRSRQGEKVSVLREELQKTIINMRDPEAVAELAAVEAEIQKLKDTFSAQRELRIRAKSAADAAGQLGLTMLADPETYLGGSDIEKILTWEDIEKAQEKRLECRAYMPWWFPYSIVTKDTELAEDTETKQLTGYEWHTAGQMGWFGMKSDEMSEIQWVEKLIEILADRDENDYLIYIDFHI